MNKNKNISNSFFYSIDFELNVFFFKFPHQTPSAFKFRNIRNQPSPKNVKGGWGVGLALNLICFLTLYLIFVHFFYSDTMYNYIYFSIF